MHNVHNMHFLVLLRFFTFTCLYLFWLLKRDNKYKFFVLVHKLCLICIICTFYLYLVYCYFNIHFHENYLLTRGYSNAQCRRLSLRGPVRKPFARPLISLDCNLKEKNETKWIPANQIIYYFIKKSLYELLLPQAYQ